MLLYGYPYYYSEILIVKLCYCLATIRSNGVFWRTALGRALFLYAFLHNLLLKQIGYAKMDLRHKSE